MVELNMLKPSDIFAASVFRGAEEVVAVLNQEKSKNSCVHAHFTSTTMGRQRFPEMIDRASRGEVIIAERYGRTLGALVNYAAVAYLAICDDPLFVEALENDDRKAAVQALLDLPEGAVKNAVHKHLLPTVRSDVAATMGSDFQEKFGL